MIFDNVHWIDIKQVLWKILKLSIFSNSMPGEIEGLFGEVMLTLGDGFEITFSYTLWLTKEHFIPLEQVGPRLEAEFPLLVFCCCRCFSLGMFPPIQKTTLTKTLLHSHT